MATFTKVIDNLIDTLKDNNALSSFVTEKWGKPLTVRKVFRNRIDISTEALPIIFVTRPSVKKDFTLSTRDGDHIVRLYCGFYQDDTSKALDEMVEFEEKIDDALLVDETRGGNAIDTVPEASDNDEGKFHPTYFMVMHMLIKHRR